MYSKIECELMKNKDLYRDYEEYPYILDMDIKKNIKYLYAHIDKTTREEFESVVKICEKYIDFLLSEGDSLFAGKCYRLLLETLKLFAFNKIRNDMPEHMFQCQLGELMEDDEFDRSLFEETLLMISILIPNLRDVLYYYERNVCVDEVIILAECKKLILNGDYFSAYEYSKRILENLFEKENDYFQTIPRYSENMHRDWIKKKFGFCLKIASIVDRIDDLQKDIESLCRRNMRSILEDDIKEFRIKCDVEKLCDNHINKLKKDDVNSIRKYFDRCNAGDNKNNLEYARNIKYLYQKVLTKIIEEDSSRSEKEYKELNCKVIALCEDVIQLIQKDRLRMENHVFSEHKFVEKKLISKMWLWDSYPGDTKEIVIEEFSKYSGDCQTLNNICQIINLFRTLNRDKQQDEIYHMLGEFIGLIREVTYLEKELFVWDYNNEYTFYTTLRTFSFLLLDEEEQIAEKRNRLSLMNSGYMNDPNEGNVLYDICREMIKPKKGKKVYEKLTSESGKKERKNYNTSLVFLKSFSSKLDKLTMWSEYGNKGEGCCIVVDGNTFKKIKTKLGLINDLNYESYLDVDDEYGLYNMLYWDSKTNEYILKGKKSEIAAQHIEKIIKHIGYICTAAEDISEESTWIDGIVNIIQAIVMKISYLIKYEEYQDEEESRLILVRNSYSKNNDIETIKSADNPLKSMLFIHYPLKTKMNEIILGPKVLDADYYAPFILKKLNEINRGNRKKTKLSTSSIDYR